MPMWLMAAPTKIAYTPGRVFVVALASVSGWPAPRAIPFCNRPGIHFPNQAKFDPLRFVAALAKLVHGDGSAVYEHSEVSEVQEDPLRLTVGQATIQADYLVIATHVPLMGKTGVVSATLFQTKIYPYSSYAIGATVPKGTVPEACFWDTSDPYYYLRVEAGEKEDYVIWGGADHKAAQPLTEPPTMKFNTPPATTFDGMSVWFTNRFVVALSSA
jgi:glycine/D-amino acid oxidase-like deaminating enzyme